MKKFLGFWAVLAVVALAWQPTWAGADLKVLQTVTLDAVPLDTAVSNDGRWIYVLTDASRLQVYAYTGELKGEMPVPEGVRAIASRPEDDLLLLMDPGNRTVQTVRVDLEHRFSTEGSPTLGPAGAPVTLTLFTDFECSYCAQLAPLLHEVQQAYPEKVRIIYKNFPLPMHEFAMEAARAAMAAHDQGEFWPFHDRLFENFNHLDPQVIESIRRELNLDADRFHRRMNDPAVSELIRRDWEEGQAAGVSGTPTVFINGRKYHGPTSLEGFSEAIEAALE